MLNTNGLTLLLNRKAGLPRMVACQWKGSSPTGPAEHWAGGSLAMSFSSLLILFNAMLTKLEEIF